jgi:putative ABC transport system permease protein
VGGLSRVFATLLFEVTPVDAASGLAILVLVIVAVLACFVPAVRATRVDPVIALRSS